MRIPPYGATSKSIIYLCLAVCSLFFTTRAASQNCDAVQSQFGEGETLRYKLYYNWGLIWISAGEAVFTLKDNGDNYHVEVVGQSFDSYSRLFKVKNTYKSTFAKSTFRPESFVRYVEENKYRRFDSLVFDRSTGMVNKLQGKNRSEAKWSTDRVEDCSFDLISILYYLRSVDIDGLKKGDRLGMNMYFDDKNYPIDMVVGKKGQKDVKNLGTYKALEVKPTVIAGKVFKEGAEMTVWVTDDTRKMPLIVESPLLVGSIKAVLTDYSKDKP